MSTLYRTAGGYPEPLRGELRGLLQDYTRYVIDKDWPAHRRGLVLQGGDHRLQVLRQTLFSYEPQSGLPEGVQRGDAREIVDPSYMARFITRGRRNIAAFSDYFRYNLFLKTKLCWADADVFVLAPFEITSILLLVAIVGAVILAKKKL